MHLSLAKIPSALKLLTFLVAGVKYRLHEDDAI
jgi:hypothetical protein